MYVECQHPKCDWTCRSESDVCVLDFVFLHGPEEGHSTGNLYDERGHLMRVLDADFVWYEYKTTWRTLPPEPDHEEILAGITAEVWQAMAWIHRKWAKELRWWRPGLRRRYERRAQVCDSWVRKAKARG